MVRHVAGMAHIEGYFKSGSHSTLVENRLATLSFYRLVQSFLQAQHMCFLNSRLPAPCFGKYSLGQALASKHGHVLSLYRSVRKEGLA